MGLTRELFKQASSFHPFSRPIIRAAAVMVSSARRANPYVSQLPSVLPPSAVVHMCSLWLANKAVRLVFRDEAASRQLPLLIRFAAHEIVNASRIDECCGCLFQFADNSVKICRQPERKLSDLILILLIIHDNRKLNGPLLSPGWTSIHQPTFLPFLSSEST